MSNKKIKEITWVRVATADQQHFASCNRCGDLIEHPSEPMTMTAFLRYCKEQAELHRDCIAKAWSRCGRAQDSGSHTRVEHSLCPECFASTAQDGRFDDEISDWLVSEGKARHKFLHSALRTLFGEFLAHGGDRLSADPITMWQVFHWSKTQTEHPCIAQSRRQKSSACCVFQESAPVSDDASSWIN